jgi:hypothetical protein
LFYGSKKLFRKPPMKCTFSRISPSSIEGVNNRGNRPIT